MGNTALDGSGSAFFDGEGDFAAIRPDPAFVLNQGSVIIEFEQETASAGDRPWGKNAAQTLFSVDALGTDIAGQLTIYIRSDGKIGVRHQTETEDHVFIGGTVTPGVPASIGYSWGPEGSTLVVNGVTVASGSDPLVLAGGDLPVVIGASQAQSTAGRIDDPRGHFHGNISRVQIHDTALAQDTPVPCFVAGTRIATPGGPRAVETLRAGDLVLTADRGARPVILVSRHRFGPADLASRPQLRPVVIAAGALGNDRPLSVSRQHALWLAGHDSLVRAIHLARFGDGRFRIAQGRMRVSYVHLMLETHELLFAEGARAESLHPDWYGAPLAPPDTPGVCPANTVRPILTGAEARQVLKTAPPGRATAAAAPPPGRGLHHATSALAKDPPRA